MTATQAGRGAADARASPEPPLLNPGHRDHSPCPSLALGPAARTTPASMLSRRSLVATRGTHGADGPDHPPAQPTPGSRDAPGRREPPQSKNEWPARDTGDTGPQAHPAPALSAAREPPARAGRAGAAPPD